MRLRFLTVLIVAGLLGLSGCATNPRTVPSPGQTTGPAASAPGSPGGSAASPGEPSGELPTESSDCEYVAAGEPAKPATPPEGTNVERTGAVVVTLQTNEGPIKITMDRAAAPCTVNSFVSLTQQKYFDATRCHRLTDSGLFVLQCGDPSATGRGGPGYQFADEVKPDQTYPAGTVAMANGGPNTNGSQFFLVYQDSTLSPDYTAFGKLDQESLASLKRIAAEGQDGSEKPNNPAEIKTATVG